MKSPSSTPPVPEEVLLTNLHQFRQEPIKPSLCLKLPRCSVRQQMMVCPLVQPSHSLGVLCLAQVRYPLQVQTLLAPLLTLIYQEPTSFVFPSLIHP